MDERMLDQADLERRGIDYSRVELWRKERDGKFPKRVHLSPRKVRWIESEITAWIAERVAARGGVT
jgi:predicted DNA-binding transcriptional regulator AlpA